MKYLLFSLLSLSAIAGRAQETGTSITEVLPWKSSFSAHTVDSVPNPPDSIWHLKGTHKKVRRHFILAWTIFLDRGDQTTLPLYRIDTMDEAFARKLDTILVWKLAADTTPGFEHGAKLLQLQEVRELHNQREGNPYWGDCMNCNYQDYWEHLKYLTKQGRPLPKRMVVAEIDILGEREPQYAVTPDPPPPLDTLHSVYGGMAMPSWITIGADTLTTLNFGSVITVGGGITWKPFPPNLTLDASWLPKRIRKRYERWAKQQQLNRH